MFRQERIGDHTQAATRLLANGRYGTFNFTVVSYGRSDHLHTERGGGRLKRRKVSRKRHGLWIIDHRNATDGGRDLLEYLQPLAAYGEIHKAEAGQIAAGMRNACDKSL